MSECRRCETCLGASHHWQADPRESLWDSELQKIVPGDYCCKHCDTRGVECEECGGPDGMGQDDILCEVCNGEGVIPVDTFDASDFDHWQAVPAEARLHILAKHYQETEGDRQRFMEGRIVELTSDMDEHPEWFGELQLPCACAECCSCA